MQKIRTIEEDIKASRQSATAAKSLSQQLKQKSVLSLIKMLILRSRKANLQNLRKTLKESVKAAVDKYKECKKYCQTAHYSKSFKMIVSLRKMLESFDYSKIAILDQLHGQIDVN
jgi:hypothetical protein